MAIVFQRLFVHSRVAIYIFGHWSAECGVSLALFFAQRTLSVGQIWRGGAEIILDQNHQFSRSRDLARLGVVWRRRRTRREARLHARIPKMKELHAAGKPIYFASMGSTTTQIYPYVPHGGLASAGAQWPQGSAEHMGLAHGVRALRAGGAVAPHTAQLRAV